MKKTGEDCQPGKVKYGRNYISTIWRHAFFFFLIDLLFGFFVVIIIYIITNLIFLLGHPWLNISERYFKEAIIAFCLLYLFSLAVVCWWRHVKLTKISMTDNNIEKTKSLGQESPERMKEIE